MPEAHVPPLGNPGDDFVWELAHAEGSAVDVVRKRVVVDHQAAITQDELTLWGGEDVATERAY